MDRFDRPWIPFLKFGPNRRSVDPFTPFRNSDRISGPWIPTFPFKNLDRFGRPWIPFLKFGPNRRSVDPFTPFRNSDQIGGPWIPTFPFKNLDRFGRPWIKSAVLGSLLSPLKNGPIRPSVDPFFKIRTKSAVRGSLHPL